MSFNSESVIITSDSNKSLLSQTAAISMESMDWGNVNTVVLEEVFVVFIGYGTVVTEVQGVVVSNIFRVNGYLFSFLIQVWGNVVSDFFLSDIVKDSQGLGLCRQIYVLGLGGEVVNDIYIVRGMLSVISMSKVMLSVISL